MAEPLRREVPPWDHSAELLEPHRPSPSPTAGRQTRERVRRNRPSREAASRLSALAVLPSHGERARRVPTQPPPPLGRTT